MADSIEKNIKFWLKKWRRSGDDPKRIKKEDKNRINLQSIHQRKQNI